MVKIPGDNVGWPYHNFLQESVFFARSFKSASYGVLRANSDKKMNVFAELHSGDSDEHNASAAQEGHHCSGYKAQDWTSIKNMSTNCKILVWKAVFVMYWQKLEEYLYGHPTLRKVISKSTEDIVSKTECDDHQPSANHQHQAYTLPRLPVPVDEMNAPAVKTVMTYLAKDLGISFKHPCLSSGHNLYIFTPDRPGEFRGLRTQRLCNAVYASSVAL